MVERISARQSARSTVTVGCKLPNGLLLRLFNMVPTDVPVMGGGTKTVLQADPVGEPVKINGYAVPFGMRPRFGIISDIALTKGVPADFWHEWLKQNQKLDVVVKGLIFAHGDTDRVEDAAEERGPELKCGLEPLDPEHLPNKKIETADVA